MSRSPLVAVLCLSLILLNVPTRSSASMAALVATQVPEDAYVAIGGDRFHVDFSSVLANRSEVADGSGSFTISVKKALRAGDDAGRTFVLGARPTVEEVRVLRPGPARTRATRAWREVIAWTLTRTPYRTTTSFEVGPDRLSVAVPQSVIDGDPLPGETVEIEVNGLLTRIPPDRYYRSVTGLLRGLPFAEEDQRLQPLADRFVDGSAFANAYIGFGLIAERFYSPGADASECVSPCMTCVASAIGSAASILAIAGACSAAGVTGGALTPACIAALLAHAGANLTTLSSCAFCINCLNTDPPGGGGDGEAGGGDDPSGECPPGYHECCNNQCCSDDMPPPGCEV